MTGEKLRLVVKKPIRFRGDSILGLPDITPSLEVTGDVGIANKLSRLKIEYQLEFRDSPASFIVHPKEYLSLWAYLASLQRSPTASLERIIYEGVQVRPCHNGIEIDLSNLTHYVWRMDQDEKPNFTESKGS